MYGFSPLWAFLWLSNQYKTEKLFWSPGLTLAARDHCLDAGSWGLVSAEGSDGSLPHQRIARYGQAGRDQGQNLAFGTR